MRIVHLVCRQVKVLFTKCIAKEDRKEMQKDVERLGGRVVSDHTFTHFVTLSPKRGEADRGFVKSLNVLIALAAGMAVLLSPMEFLTGLTRRALFFSSSAALLHPALVCCVGRPIVTDLWITASKASSAFVPAHEFMLQDGAAERKYGFTLATAYVRAQQRPLLSGINVYFTPGNCC